MSNNNSVLVFSSFAFYHPMPFDAPLKRFTYVCCSNNNFVSVACLAWVNNSPGWDVHEIRFIIL